MLVSANQVHLILASKSPRRRELLAQIGVNFEVVNVDIDESVKDKEEPLSYVKRVTLEKGRAALASEQLCAIENYQNKPVLSADTCIILDGTVLGKPQGKTKAVTMINQLAGRTHQVVTAVAIVSDVFTQVELSVSKVKFASLDQEQILRYCETGEGLDKAGGYAIQGLAAQFVEAIEGSYSGIVGLPLYETSKLIKNYLELTS
ncbi:MAG: Maf family nucleotide pyrophosphatase [Kangiellaceae bacterium]|nr:Maf family nucleotide pyrophosphatase [Kangiellaceae bacterium]